MTRDTGKSRTPEKSGVYKSVHTPLDHYLKSRPDGKSDKYYLVYPVPSDLQQIVGKRYERKSTGTTNLRDARRVAAKLVAQLEDKFKVLYAQLGSLEAAPAPEPHAVPTLLSDVLIDSFCERWRIAHLHSDDRERDDGLDSDDIEDIEVYAKAIELDAREINQMGKKAPSFSHILEEALDWAETLGYLISEKDIDVAKYVRKFAAEKLIVAESLRARNRGDTVVTPSMPERYLGKTLTEYKEIWLRSHIAGLVVKTRNLYSGRIDQFVRFLNNKFPELNGMPLRVIEGRHVQAFVNFLMHEEELNPKSINDGHVPPLRSIFGFAVADGEAEDNPCKNIKLSKLSKATVAERARPRDAFTTEFLNQLFKSSWYGVGKEGILESPLYADLSARYWVPLILLCHGLRPIEVCQLTVSDIHYVDSILCFKVAEDDDKVAKTEATRRGLPVHEKLLELGFEKFVQNRKQNAKPQNRLFPVLEGRPDPAKWYTQAFNRYIRRFLYAPDVYTPHSFRHVWEDNRRAAQAEYGSDRWPRGMHFQLSGREDIEKEEGSAKDYGNKYTAAQMHPFLCLIWDAKIVLPVSFSDFEANAFVTEASQRAFEALKI